MMHPKVHAALEEIDAAVMNGDTFENPEHRKTLLDYLDSWRRQLTRICPRCEQHPAETGVCASCVARATETVEFYAQLTRDKAP